MGKGKGRHGSGKQPTKGKVEKKKIGRRRLFLKTSAGNSLVVKGEGRGGGEVPGILSGT